MSKIVLLALLGSPRRKGNTETVLDAAISGAEGAGAHVEKIVLDRLNIKPCRECYTCSKNGHCVIEDDMQPLYDKIYGSNRIILASPIFFMNFSAQAKLMIDRCQCFWERKYDLKEKLPDEVNGISRKGSIIAVGGAHNRNLFEGVLMTAKVFFDAINVKMDGTLLFRGADDKDYMKGRPDLLEFARQFGEEFVSV
ncbi:MAG: flavodoxin family protein [Actinobacteria bacterium]|nr:flavodoxin family protein [Actinomycetota bacterium]